MKRTSFANFAIGTVLAAILLIVVAGKADTAHADEAAPNAETAHGEAEYSLVVNHDQSVEKAKEAGQYGFANGDINSRNFPKIRKGTSRIVLKLVCFGRDIKDDEVAAELAKRGLRPADLRELLALGAAFPKVQCSFPILALGSILKDTDIDRYAPVLCKTDDRRDLDLLPLSAALPGTCHFAAIKEE